MPLVTLKEILPEARRQKRAVGAFNVANVEAAMGVIRAAEGEKLPAIVQIFQRLFLTEKGSDLAGAVLRMAHRCRQPIVVHLDHGGSPEIVRKALAAGVSSVMFDGSTLPFEKNAELTKYAADYAHTLGASCEGEIGHVAMGDENAITTVEDAVAFHKATGVDALAVSIGTVHGFYKAEPKIEAGRCTEIAEALPGVPLVLHGGTGTPPADLRKVIENGISKINIATEFMDTFLKSTRRELDKLGGGFAPIDKFMDPVIDDCAAHAARLLKFFAGK